MAINPFNNFFLKTLYYLPALHDTFTAFIRSFVRSFGQCHGLNEKTKHLYNVARMENLQDSEACGQKSVRQISDAP